ncbi:hypothetical protein DI487_13240 [Flavobacterium sediminis]|uniref:Uncharacterized protein n=1 Tax=Flavobacterium sediminis TaxID=2201181 RepID=A0A2U8QXU2_9FLAO|nr:hypothetical protein [Flavobacterium sediminis]AWM14726.1 hypothetical protein DI487_13240 [Flavobacterium sediminis]
MLINLFKKPTEKCPRCLGKGFVDNNDIERLNKKLEWLPGKCAYCFGKGKVNKQTISSIPADLSYLTLNRSKIERLKLTIGNKNAKKRAELYQKNLNDLINHITKQYFVGQLDIETIADLHFARFKIKHVSIEEKKEFMKYTEKVIELNRDKHK